MRIVIVEDNKLVLQVLTAAFDAVGTYELSDFGTATAGLEACRNGADLAIFDHRLPDMKGIEAVRMLRADDATQHLPIIMVTADDDPATRLAAIKAGVTDFLKKPVNIEELRLRVRNLLALREAQKSAAEREELLKTVIAASGTSLAVIEVATSGDRFVFASDGFLTATGCVAGDILGRDFKYVRHIFPHSEAFTELEDSISDRAAGRFVLTLQTRNGARKWVEVLLRPVPQPGSDATYLVLTLEDISDLVSAREASRELLDRMADIARISGAWFFEIDTSGRLTYISDTMARGLGVLPEHILGERLDKLPLSLNDPNKKDRPLSSLFAPPYSAIDNEELLVRSPDGKTRCIQVSVVPFTNPKGEFSGYRGSASDVSAIAAARDAAARASRAKSAFLTTMSHELQTPLTAIIGMADIMNENARTSEDRHQLRLVTEAAKGLSDVLGNVLDLAALDHDAIVLHEADLDLVAVLDDLTSVYSVQASGKGLVLDVEVQGARGQLRRGDGRRVRQVFEALVSNAVKFTETGIVRVLLCTEQRDEISLTVTDTGIGMETAEIEKALEPFAQLDDGMARRFEGSGMGLSIAHGLATAMDGQLDIQSTSGQGTTVRAVLRLPSALSQNPFDMLMDLAGRRILVADDNAANRKILQMMLQKLGADVTMCVDGDVAIQAWHAGKFDLLLLDINMPRLTGTDVIREIRQIEASDGQDRIPAIAVTANAAAQQVRGYLEAGFDHCLGKPFTTRTLSAALYDVLGQQTIGAT